jgi:hypothetical protein
MLWVVSEDTERVIGERRMATLRDLGSDPSVVRTEQETLGFAGRQLASDSRLMSSAAARRAGRGTGRP